MVDGILEAHLFSNLVCLCLCLVEYCCIEERERHTHILSLALNETSLGLSPSSLLSLVPPALLTWTVAESA
jgi:hypothetical protein